MFGEGEGHDKWLQDVDLLNPEIRGRLEGTGGGRRELLTRRCCLRCPSSNQRGGERRLGGLLGEG